MRTYNQIILSELAAQKSILLEGVGFLKIESIPARMEGNNSISAPRNIVVYAADAPPNAQNVILILESEGVDYQQARDQYYSWLHDARKEEVLFIEGAGELRDGIFTPTEELEKRLNPISQKAVAVKRKSKAWLWILLALVILTLVLFGYRHCVLFEHEPKQPATVQPAAPIVPEARDTVATSKPATAPMVVDQSPVNKSLSPVEGRFYVVGGVFDITENADKLIAQLKRKYTDLTFEKFDYPGTRSGRTMVSIFSSTKYEEALNMRRQMAWNYDMTDYWIYPPKY